MEYKRYTEKRNGKNVIPLRKAVCGIDLPKWSIHEESDIQSFLSGDAVDRLAELEDKIEQGTLVDTEEYFFLEENQWAGKNRFLVCKNDIQLVVCDFCETREEAEKRLEELQE